MDGWFLPPTPGESAGFGSRGDTIVSVERISPIAVIELERTGQGKVETSRTLVATVGDTPSEPPIQRTPRLAVDTTLSSGVTIGGSLYFATILAGEGNPKGPGPEGAPMGTAAGIAPRIGAIVPFGRSLAVWPRAGVSYVAVAPGAAGGGASARIEGTLDAAVCIFPVRGVALTVTPAMDVALGGKPNDVGKTARMTFTGGLLGHIPEAAYAPHEELGAPRSPSPGYAIAKGGAVTVSADRLLPIVDVVHLDEPPPGTPSWQAESGITHAFALDRQLLPRFAADVTVARGVTMGVAFSFNITPWESVRRSAYIDSSGRAIPGAVSTTDLHAASFGAEPRLGWVKPLGENSAIWLRGGLTYVLGFVYQPGSHVPVASNGTVALSSQSYDDQVAHRLDVSLDPEFVYFVTRGFGVSAGPVFDATVLGGFHDRAGGFPYGLPGPPLVHVGATAGALVSF